MKYNNYVKENKMIYTDNPLHVEIVQTLVPVANEVLEEVRIEVSAEEVVDPKQQDTQEQNDPNFKKKCKNIIGYMYIGFLVFILIGILAAFCLFIAWLNNPYLFGTNPF